MKPQLTEERTTFKPFKYPWAYDAWLQHEQSHWLHTEVPMGEDLKDYQKAVAAATAAADQFRQAVRQSLKADEASVFWFAPGQLVVIGDADAPAQRTGN